MGTDNFSEGGSRDKRFFLFFVCFLFVSSFNLTSILLLGKELGIQKLGKTFICYFSAVREESGGGGVAQLKENSLG